MRYIVKVYDDGDTDLAPRTYSVPASTELDARVIAFALDGGLDEQPAGLRDRTLEDGEIELAKTYTEVLGVVMHGDEIKSNEDNDDTNRAHRYYGG